MMRLRLYTYNRILYTKEALIDKYICPQIKEPLARCNSISFPVCVCRKTPQLWFHTQIIFIK